MTKKLVGQDEIEAQKQMEKKDRLKLLSTVLEKLPEQQRLIIQLRDIEELEFDQIAEIMDTNVNALRVSLSRARNRLKEELTKFNEYGNQRNTGVAG